MLKPYTIKLENIKNEILKMGLSSVSSLDLCLQALKNEDIEKLGQIVISEKENLKKANEIDRIIVSTLALYSPEAKDLRQLVAFLKITNEITRIASNIRDFAKMFKKSYSKQLNTNIILEYAIPLLKAAHQGVEISISMIEESNDKTIEEKFKKIVVYENKTDDLYLMIEKNILKLITKELELSKSYFDILSSLRRLEKIADRAVCVARLLYFAKIGGDIEQS